jgi:pimeloyl-ACP methyl ester carboxylesterase
VDFYAFGFTSKMFQRRLAEESARAAIKLNDYLQRDGVDKYDQIVFVAHSMGGLVTMRELISHPEIRAKTPLLVFLRHAAAGLADHRHLRSTWRTTTPCAKCCRWMPTSISSTGRRLG